MYCGSGSAAVPSTGAISTLRAASRVARMMVEKSLPKDAELLKIASKLRATMNVLAAIARP